MQQSPKENADYQKRIIEVLVLQNKLAEANKVLQEILNDNPKDDQALAIRAALKLNNATRDELQAALNDLQTAVTRLPQDPVVRYNFGRAHMMRGNIQ
jgi:predicted Zn-dependent protease